MFEFSSEVVLYNLNKRKQFFLSLVNFIQKMAQDKEKIKELTRKIQDLEAVITSRGQQVQDYQDIERIADGNKIMNID